MSTPLCQAAKLSAEKVVGPTEPLGRIESDTPVLIVLAAGKGTRFGAEPKCIQSIAGKALGRHSIDAFAAFSPAPSICLVGYRADQVADELAAPSENADGGTASNIVFVRSDDPAGGTAWAAMEAFSVEQLSTVDPVVVVTMGDRIVPESIFRQLLESHLGPADDEATLTMLTANYRPPANIGKGRIVRSVSGGIQRIIEQRDIDALESEVHRDRWNGLTEGNCPLYAIRAATLRRYLGATTPGNAQRQYYFTDIVEAIEREGGLIRSVTVDPSMPEYDLLCADVTRPDDLPKLEAALKNYTASVTKIHGSDAFSSAASIGSIARSIALNRSSGQTAAIARQCDELHTVGRLKALGFDPQRPIGIGVSGGRLRIAFMHPDMGRFFGPAWQMPIGATDESGDEQIVVMVQAAEDNQIRLYPTQRQFREQVNSLPSDLPCMYPPEDVADAYAYESFGTSMTRELMSQLGYFSDAQIADLIQRGADLPDAAKWISNGMRRPFALLGNAIVSLRTLRDGALGQRVQSRLGRGNFSGLKVASTGEIPQGGFSSSSAFTVAAINAIDALFDFQLEPEQKIRVACQSEYGTGVRAGALDQATEQSGQYKVGSLISSNPKDDFRIIGSYEVPADRFRVLFPYTVDRDSQAWKWSSGVYAATVGEARLTSEEMRKMTGKSSELAAILTRLPLDVDFFQEIQEELVERGSLSSSTMLHVRDLLRQVPLKATQTELRTLLRDHVDWYVTKRRSQDVDFSVQQAHRMFDSLLGGWRDPHLRRRTADGHDVEEVGAPLRAMLAYLYGEVAKNCYMIHHPAEWITWVTRSQRGDKCFEINADALPSKQQMMRDLAFERSVSGAERMERWLGRVEATPFDFNRGIEDADLSSDQWSLTEVPGTNFFRGLALIDLAEAMLKRAFGGSAVAVRVNGAGQGDYFQVHVDTQQAAVAEVKDFVRRAIYRRFGLKPRQDFVEPRSGGGAVGIRLERFADVTTLVQEIRRQREPAGGRKSINSSQPSIQNA